MPRPGPPAEPAPVVTELLRAWAQGDASAGERLFPIVHAELRRQAGRFMWRERRNHTLQSSALERLPGTDDAAKPFWSPDSRRIGFFANGKLMTVDVVSRAVRNVADVDVVVAGGSWGPDDTILFALWPSGLYAARLETPDGHDCLRWLGDQEWFDGRAAMIGLSIGALPMFRLAAGEAPAGVPLRALVDLMGVADLHSLFYRQGAKVDGTVDVETGPAPIIPGFPPINETFRSGAIFQVPSVAGTGLAWRSRGGRMTLAAEIDHVGYEGLVQLDEEGSVGYSNAWEYHIGAEYALLQSTPILAFRAGAWVEKRGEEAFFGDTDVTHLSAGLGIVTSLVQIDLAGDFSDRGDTAALSFIYNF